MRPVRTSTLARSMSRPLGAGSGSVAKLMTRRSFPSGSFAGGSQDLVDPSSGVIGRPYRSSLPALEVRIRHGNWFILQLEWFAPDSEDVRDDPDEGSTDRGERFGWPRAS
jgi:hypothetical protein